MTDSSGSDRLLDEAIDLMIRLQNDPDNPVAQSMVKSWRGRSSRHEQIWQKVAGAHGASGHVLKERNRAARKDGSKITRRKLIVGGLAGIGAAGAGALTVPDVMVWASADHITPKGEVRRVELADGSLSTLGPESAIAVDYAPGRRRVELLKGMAYFEVAKDASRPFSVETRGLVVEAVGTAFDVSDDAGCTSVCVAQGSVETRARRKYETRAVSVAAGQWLSFDAGTGSVERGVRELDQVASWRDGLLVADREPISALVARIGRWYPGRIVVLDPSIGVQRVSGLFDLNDPGAALEAIVHPAGARVRHISSYVAVISPI